MSDSKKPANIRVIGVPMDLGQSRRGVDMGPSAVRYAQLQARLERLGYHLEDCGNVVVPPVEEIEGRAKPAPSSIGYAHHLDLATLTGTLRLSWAGTIASVSAVWLVWHSMAR